MKTIDEIELGYANYRSISQIKPMVPAVRTFLNFCRKCSLDGHISQDVVDVWFLKRTNETLNSHYTRVIHVKKMLDYAINKGWTDVKIDINVRWHPRKKKIIFLTGQEISNFFRAIKEDKKLKLKSNQRPHDFYVCVSHAMFLMIFSAGLRPIEARMLSCTDIDLETGIVTIRFTKGYREHIVVLSDEMKEVLKKYDEKVDAIIPNRKAFFPNKQGLFYAKGWLANRFRKYWYKYNSREAVTYNFRHNYAIENINSWQGMAVEKAYDRLLALSRSMGHSKLSHTLYYYSLTPQYAQSMSELSSDNINKIIHNIEDEEEIQEELE